MRPRVGAPGEREAAASLDSRGDRARCSVLVAVDIGGLEGVGSNEACVEVLGVPCGYVREGTIVYFLVVVIHCVKSVSVWLRCYRRYWSVVERVIKEHLRKNPWLFVPSVVKLFTNPWPITDAANAATVAREAFILSYCRRSNLFLAIYQTPIITRLYTFSHPFQATPARSLAASKESILWRATSRRPSPKPHQNPVYCGWCEDAAEGGRPLVGYCGVSRCIRR